MFEVASFSLRSLLVFRPLMRGGEGAEKSSESEVSSDEGTKDASPTWAEDSPPRSMGSFFEPREAGFEETASKVLMSGMPCSWTAATSGSCTSSSWRTAKLFLFSGRGEAARGSWEAFC